MIGRVSYRITTSDLQMILTRSYTIKFLTTLYDHRQ